MEDFDGLLKSIEWNKNIQKYLDSTARTLKAKGRVFSGVSMIAEISKNLQQQDIFADSTLSPDEALTETMSTDSNFAIPENILNAISSINKQHEQLLGNLKGITQDSNERQVVSSQINNWQFAISGISGQLAAIASRQRKWDIIDDFEAITQEAVLLNERIYDDNGVSKDGLNELIEFFKRIEAKVDEIDTDVNTLFWKYLTLLGVMLGILGETRNWQPKPTYATKEEVDAVIKHQYSLYKRKLKEDKEYSVTNRECRVLIKPKIKSLVVEKLPNNFEIVVLHVNRKWVYVSYESSKTNLPKAGWILKKYLNKPYKR